MGAAAHPPISRLSTLVPVSISPTWFATLPCWGLHPEETHTHLGLGTTVIKTGLESSPVQIGLVFEPNLSAMGARDPPFITRHHARSHPTGVEVAGLIFLTRLELWVPRLEGAKVADISPARSVSCRARMGRGLIGLRS